MTPPESSTPSPEPEDERPDSDPPEEESPPPEPAADTVPDTLPEDWIDAPPAPAAEEEADDDAEPVAEVDEDEADIDALADHIGSLEAKLEAAERRADELLGVSKRQAEMADQLHAETQRLRDGEIAQAVAPLIRNAARIADELSHMLKERPDDPDLEHVAKRLGELLHDAGVTSVVPVAGDPFDPRAHQAAGAAPTEDETLDRCVAEVRRPGLVRDDGRLIRPAEVVVHRYQGAAP